MASTKLYHGNCLTIMDEIPDKSIDFIFADLPFGTTQNKWDCLIDLKQLWVQYRRIIKENGCIALWCQIPFNIVLGYSNLEMLRYEWVIEKNNATGHLNAKKMPMKAHENVMIFYKKLPTYNPQKTTGHKPVNTYTKHTDDGSNYGASIVGRSGGGQTDRYPRDVLRFKWDTQKSSFHPTQKPLAACEYFIKTYTNEGDLVLDNCMGSGTTGVACSRLNRDFIGIESEKKYYDIAEWRIKNFNV